MMQYARQSAEYVIPESEPHTSIINREDNWGKDWKACTSGLTENN